MFAKLYDICICYIWRRSKRREVDRLYREVLKGLKDCNGNVRPVDIFLKMLEPLLNGREKRMVVVIRDLVEGQSVSFGLDGRRNPYSIRLYVFPKYPFKGERFNGFKEFMAVLKNTYPFIGSARRRIG
jgi:hypothetical protein